MCTTRPGLCRAGDRTQGLRGQHFSSPATLLLPAWLLFNFITFRYVFVSSALLPCEPWGTNSGHQVWWPLPVPAGPRCLPGTPVLPSSASFVLESQCADHACYLYPIVQVITAGLVMVTWFHVSRPLGVRLGWTSGLHKVLLHGFHHRSAVPWPEASVSPCHHSFPKSPTPHPSSPQPVLCPRAGLSHRGPAQPFASSPLPATPPPSPFRSPPVLWLG